MEEHEGSTTGESEYAKKIINKTKKTKINKEEGSEGRSLEKLWPDANWA